MAEVKRFIDIHSHIIWGADDGAGSSSEAIAMLKKDRDEGAYAVFATPHYGKKSCFTPRADGVMRNFAHLQELAALEVPEVTLYLGTEWYCTWELARSVRRNEAFRMNGTSYVLAEFYDEPAERITEDVLTLKEAGFLPILAHPERYVSLQDEKNYEVLRNLADAGILLQVNAYDLELNLSLKTKELARWLARERLVSFIGSDMHGLEPYKREPRMREGILWLYENTEKAYADAVAFGNAEKLLKAHGTKS